MRRVWLGTAALAMLLMVAWVGARLYPRSLHLKPMGIVPRWERQGTLDVLKVPDRYLVARIDTYDDEMFAYLMFQYFSGSRYFKDCEVLLSFRRDSGGLTYPVEVVLENNMLASLPLLTKAQVGGVIRQYEWRYLDAVTLNSFRYRTHVFVMAYNMETRQELRRLKRADLAAYVRRFVRFKAAVDPRIRRKIAPVPAALSKSAAHGLARDIVAISDFYSLPLEFFLGIGAMENNYLNVSGDSRHAVWKKRADRGDVVLKRRGGSVLVHNPSAGVWQITRETLRYVHNLYLADRRDYSALPERLRPPRELDLDHIDPDILTTYAGLLFRRLLDLFHGDVASAVGAYNGGAGNPNAHYAEGVARGAEHARWFLQSAAALHGQPAVGMRFLVPAR
jgi:hypothetical protein